MKKFYLTKISVLFICLILCFCFLAMPTKTVFSDNESEELIFFEGFEDGLSNWNLDNASNFSLNESSNYAVKDTGSKSLYMNRQTGEETAYYKNSFTFSKTATYTVSFKIYFRGGVDSNSNSNIQLFVSPVNSGESAVYSEEQVYSSSPAKTWIDNSFEVSFENSESSDIEVNLGIYSSAGYAKCYIDDISITKKSNKISEIYEVNNDTVCLIDGASIRVDAENPGLRFSGKVDKTVYDEYVSDFSDVNAGILIVPKDYLQDLTDFTFGQLINKNKKYLDIKALKWNNIDSAESDGFYGFSCVISEILPQNLDREFSARAYLRYTEDGVTKYIYSDFSEEKNSRSVNSVAKKFVEIYSFPEDVGKVINYFATAVKDLEGSKDFELVFNDNEYSSDTSLSVKAGCVKISVELTVGAEDFEIKAYDGNTELSKISKNCFSVPNDTDNLNFAITVNGGIIRKIKVTSYKSYVR